VDVADAIRSLAALGVSVKMITGDNEPVTQHLAAWVDCRPARPAHCRRWAPPSPDRAVRVQALTPIPSAPTLEMINQALLARMDARLDRATSCRASGSCRCSSPSSSPPGVGLALHGATGPAANHEPDSNRRPAQQQIDIVLVRR
jgi:magnesium-transporting ATPase (P-type)